MNKKLILGLALAMVLVSGAFLNAHAEHVSGPYFSDPACWAFACGNANVPAKDMDRPDLTLITPEQMGSPGY